MRNIIYMLIQKTHKSQKQLIYMLL